MKTMRSDMVKPDFSSADKNEFRNVQPNRDTQYKKGKEKKPANFRNNSRRRKSGRLPWKTNLYRMR